MFLSCLDSVGVTSAVRKTKRVFNLTDKGLNTYSSLVDIVPPITIAPKSLQQFAIVSTELVKV